MRGAVAALANELCNDNVDLKQIHALVSCRLIALDECPEFRPIGIGECLKQILSKCVVEVTKNYVTKAFQTNKLFSGLNSGCEGACEGAMNDLFQSNCNPNLNWGLLLEDTKNAFNMSNRKITLWQARCHRPKAARFIC